MIAEYLKKIDILSPKIDLFYNKNSRHISSFSGFLSLVVIIIFITFTIYSAYELFQRNFPMSYTTNKFQEDFGIVSMNQNNMFHTFRMLYLNYTPVPFDETYFTLSGYLVSVDSISLRKLIKYEYSLCKWEVDGKGLEQLYVKEIFEQNYCIRKAINLTSKESFMKVRADDKFPYPFISHGVDNPANVGKYRIFRFEFNECVNTTENMNCKPREEILQKLSYKTYEFNIIDNNFDVSDFKSPIIRYILSENGILIPMNVITNNFNIFPYTVISSEDLLLDLPVSTFSYKQGYNEKSNSQQTEREIIICNILPKNSGTSIIRKYKRLQDLCATVGGFLNFVINCCLIINYLPNKYQVLKDTCSILDKNKLVKSYTNNFIQKSNIKILTQIHKVSDLIGVPENKTKSNSKTEFYNNPSKKDTNIRRNAIIQMSKKISENSFDYISNQTEHLEEFELYGDKFRKLFNNHLNYTFKEMFCICRDSQRNLQDEMNDLRLFLLSEETIITCILDKEKIKNHLFTSKEKLRLKKCSIDKKTLINDGG
jgi:hypothetical protein